MKIALYASQDTQILSNMGSMGILGSIFLTQKIRSLRIDLDRSRGPDRKADHGVCGIMTAPEIPSLSLQCTKSHTGAQAGSLR